MIVLTGATFASVMETVGYVLIALLCLLFMVVIHELGHYAAGKLLGFKITEFSIGFGPRILKIKNKKNGEIFSIRPIPLGGFCQFYGEDGEETEEGAFNAQKPWKRLIVLFSGAFFNLLSSFVLITLIFTFYGQLLPTVQSVRPESYLYANDLIREGDVIVAVNGRAVNILMQEDLNNAFSRIDGEEYGTFTILRDGEKKTVQVKRSSVYVTDAEGNVQYDENGDPKTYSAFGFVSRIGYVKLPFFMALGRSFGYVFFLVYKILWLLGALFTGGIKFSESAGGPITIITAMSDSARTGFGSLAYVVCLISANLAVMNLLPLPALDGSRMVFTTIEWIRGKPINRKIEAVIHTIGIVLLFAFALLADFLQLVK